MEFLDIFAFFIEIVCILCCFSQNKHYYVRIHRSAQNDTAPGLFLAEITIMTVLRRKLPDEKIPALKDGLRNLKADYRRAVLDAARAMLHGGGEILMPAAPVKNRLYEHERIFRLKRLQLIAQPGEKILVVFPGGGLDIAPSHGKSLPLKGDFLTAKRVQLSVPHLEQSLKPHGNLPPQKSVLRTMRPFLKKKNPRARRDFFKEKSRGPIR